jgi:hypothetical protein
MQQTRSCTYSCSSTTQCVNQTQCNQYTVIHDANGGDCDDSTVVYYDANVSGPSSCSRTDYNLTGYTLVSGTCNTSFNSSTGDCNGVRSNVEIRAEWTLDNNAPTAPTSLLAEGETNPTDVLNVRPEFNAIYNDPDTSDTSSYYEVEVNTASDFTGTVMWDSDKTPMLETDEGTRSPNITYNGTTLTYNGQTYYWRIRFWDSSDVVGDWSSTANFTMDIPTAHYYEIEVNTASDFTGTSMWDTGKTSMTPITAGERIPEVDYAGDQLNQGVTYYWRMRYWDMNDNVSPWSQTSTFQIDMPPTAQAPTPVSTSSINWNFTDNSDDELGFRVYDTSDQIKVTCDTPNISSCLEEGLSENTQYSRKIAAYNSVSRSSFSDVVSIFTKASTVSIINTAKTSSTITLESSTFQNDNLNDSGYYFDCTSSSCDTGINEWIQTKTDTATGLENNTGYSFRVKNRNADALENIYSLEEEIWTEATIPSISNGSLTNTTIILQASGINNLEQGISGLYFDCITGENCDSGINEWVSTTSDTVVGLLPNTEYEFKVKGRNYDGVETIYSTNSVTIHTEATEPAITSVDNPTVNTLEVTINNQDNPSTTTYVVEEVNTAKYIDSTGSLVADPVWLTYDQLGSTSGITVTGLQSNTEYTFRVKARNQSDVETAYSDPVSSFTKLTAPTAEAVTSKTENSITWKLLTSETGYEGIRVYDNADNLITTCVGADITECEETGLTPNTQCSRKLTIYSTQSESAYSSLITERTYAESVSISLISALNYYEASLTIDLADNPIGTDLQIYEENTSKYFDQLSGNLVEGEQTFESTSEPITVTGLEPNTEYIFKVRAVDGDSNLTTWSQTSSVRTFAQMPNIVSATPLSTTSGRLTLDIGDNPISTRISIIEDGGQYITESGLLDNSEQIFVLSGETIDITGLSPNTGYGFKVRAYNEDNVASNWSSTSELVTLIEQPIVEISDQTEDSVTLTISGVSNITHGDSGIYVEDIAEWSQDLTQTVTQLNPNSSYTFNVKARNTNGEETSYVESESVYTLAAIPSVSSTSPNSSSSGTLIVDLGENPAGTRVSIIETESGKYLNSNSQLVMEESILNTESLDFTVNGLEANMTYGFKIKAYNENDVDTEFSTEEYTLTTLTEDPTVTVSDITSSSADVTISGVSNIPSGSSGIFIERIGTWSKNLTQRVTDLNSNTAYTFRVRARNKNGVSGSYVSSEGIHTLAEVPAIASVRKLSANTARVYLDTNGNPSYTEMAIRDEVSGQYVNANGRLQTNPVWQTYSQWGGGLGKYVSGLDGLRQIGFAVKARNRANVESDFSVAEYIGTGSVIRNIPTTIEANLKDGEQVDLSTDAQLGIKDIRLKRDNYLIADVKVSFEQDRDWSDVKVESDFENSKTVIKISDKHGITAPFTMYVVRNDTNAFRICPQATSLSEVVEGCIDELLITEGFPAEVEIEGNIVTISEAKIDGVFYWIADGLTGTGGMGEKVEKQEQEEEQEPYETPEEEEGDEQEEVSVASRIGKRFTETAGRVSKDIVLGTKEILDQTRISELNQAELSTAVATTTTVTITVGVASTGFAQSFFLVFHLVNSIFNALGFRRKKKPFGYVYDSSTKEPVSNAVVRIYKGEELVETTVTDSEGMFLSSLDTGEYRVKVKKGGYEFPSNLIKGNEDYPLKNIYKGGLIERGESSDLVINIPLDRKDLSEAKKLSTVFKSVVSVFLTMFNILLFAFGILLIIYTYYKYPGSFSWYIVLLYIPALYFLSKSIFSKSSVYGKVVDENGKAVVGKEIFLIDKEFDEVVGKRVTDERGRYRFVCRKGDYQLKMGKKVLINDLRVRRDGYVLAKRLKLE